MTNMKYDFDKITQRRGTNSYKWDSTDDKEVLLQLGQIKKANKDAFAKWAYRQQGVVLNTDGIFDVQVKRLHEYKRQLMETTSLFSMVWLTPFRTCSSP